ncbi:class I SAM-dependent methyltransferase [Psychrobacter lutiphocae]|uniref:class I SAM-dependent methyltransferase n=1 Tax=Psychrobacter lutiphocae TaxID=540500 RepID=UPI00036FC565|nr:class I SAM-dependent methyltransferase [Psychrobacter lutiphocae]
MWNERYNEEEFIYGTKANDFLQQVYQHIPAKGHVLCLAEGEGRNAVFLAKQGYEVTAVDMSEVGLTKAKKLAEERGVHITTQVADLTEYDFGTKKWDGIISIWAHMPKPARERVHQQVVTSLKPNGVFILEAYTVEQPKMDGIGGPPASKPEVFMSLAGLRQELSGLEETIGVEKQRDVQEGKMHQGLSAVVQFVAVKK